MQSNIYINISEWILLFTAIASLLFSILYRSKKSMAPIQLYIVISVINGVLLKCFDLIPALSIHLKTSQIVMNVYSLLEISLIFYFFLIQFKIKRYRKTILLVYTFYPSLCLYLWIVKELIASYYPPLFGVENFLITIASLYYILNFIKSDKIIDFKSSPEFIASCGILFYFSITTPFFLVYSILYSASATYAGNICILNYLANSILFLSFIKADLCPSPRLKYLRS
jgi:hypothetical protein